MAETPIHFTTEKAEAVFAGHGKRLGKIDLRKPNRLNVKRCLRPCDRVEHIFATREPVALRVRISKGENVQPDRVGILES